MSSIKRVFLTFLACLILLFSFVFPSLAVDYTLSVNTPNPVSIGYDGYFTVPYTNGTYTYLQVVFWKAIRTNTSYANDIVAEDLLVHVHFTSTSSFEVTYEHVGGDVIFVTDTSISSSYGFQGLGSSALVTDNIPLTTSYACPAGYTYLYPQEYSGVYEFTSATVNGRKVLSQLPLKSYNVVWSNNDTYKQLSDIITHFGSMLQKQDYTNEQLDTLVEKFGWLLDSVYNLEYTLDEFVFYYWADFANVTFPNGINDITSRLDKIYKLLNKKGETEQTTVDSSKVDDYIDIEQSLVNNESADDALNNFDVSIDGESYSFIWTLITDLLNSHPEVFGLFIAVLTLGFLALILNR